MSKNALGKSLLSLDGLNLVYTNVSKCIEILFGDNHKIAVQLEHLCESSFRITLSIPSYDKAADFELANILVTRHNNNQLRTALSLSIAEKICTKSPEQATALFYKLKMLTFSQSLITDFIQWINLADNKNILCKALDERAGLKLKLSEPLHLSRTEVELLPDYKVLVEENGNPLDAYSVSKLISHLKQQAIKYNKSVQLTFTKINRFGNLRRHIVTVAPNPKGTTCYLDQVKCSLQAITKTLDVSWVDSEVIIINDQ